MLKAEGWSLNIKKVYRICRRAKLQRPVRRKVKAKKSSPQRSLPKPSSPSSVWAMDFFFTKTSAGGRVKVLVIIDEFSRLALRPLVSSITPEDLVEHLRLIGKEAGFPRWIRCDNGPKFTSEVFRISAEVRIKVHYIEPGKPFQNGYSESLIGKFKEECLVGFNYRTVAEAREKIEEWFRFYNEERPHSALSYKTPLQFYMQWRLSDGV